MKSYTYINKIRLDLISLKQSILNVKPFAFNGNTKDRIQYCNKLQSLLGTFTPYQTYALLGLLLSDASLQASSSGKKFRLKMQQSIRHSAFANHILREVIPEWVIKTSAQQASVNRSSMLELQTLTHEAFSVLASIISYPPFNPYQVVPKIFGINIIRWLHPITIAYWFMGDGSKESSRALYSGRVPKARDLSARASARAR